MNVFRLLVAVATVTAVAGTGATAPVAPGDRVTLRTTAFPAGDQVRATLYPGAVPLGSATAPAVSFPVPVWAPEGSDRLVLVDQAGVRETEPLTVAGRRLLWPVTMRLLGVH